MAEYFEPVDGVIESIELLRYQPGDVLVIKAGEVITAQHADHLKHYTEARMPGITALVVGPGFEFQLYRPTDGETDR